MLYRDNVVLLLVVLVTVAGLCLVVAGWGR